MRDGRYELVLQLIGGFGSFAGVVLQEEQFVAAALGTLDLGTVLDREQQLGEARGRGRRTRSGSRRGPRFGS